MVKEIVAEEFELKFLAQMCLCLLIFGQSGAVLAE